ncbi:hypothetical protein DFQ26_006741 [Actinomortierella ambigua]|nr:hypothetical protein DFQ26_006741 [Actinomortierella ambigua]
MGLLALASSVFADVKYSVVAFPENPANQIDVVVNGKPHRLQTIENTPVWSATVPGVSGSDAYYYAEVDSADKEIAREKFERRLRDVSKAATPNEFFGREQTFFPVPKLEQVFAGGRKNPSKIFDDTQIATMHFQVDAARFATMMENPHIKDLKAPKASFAFINADIIYTADDVKFSVSGNSSRMLEKVSLKASFPKTLPEGDLFSNRRNIKLRAEATDPSMMREMLYSKCLEKLGVLASEASWVRVYVNNKPQGLYLMMQDIEDDFIMNTIHQGTITNKTELGSLYQMTQAEAPMAYISDNAADYGEIYDTKFSMNVGKKEPGGKKDPKKNAERDAKKLERWITFMKDLHVFQSDNKDPVAYWSDKLELQSYLVAMVMEYLTGACDLFMRRGHNYAMYYNSKTSRYHFIPMDFDLTFNNCPKDRPNPELSYEKWVPEGAVRPLVTKLIYNNEIIKKEFEKVLFTVTKKLFNPRVLFPLIDAYAQQIKAEVEWDSGVQRTTRTGVNFIENTVSFDVSINGPGNNKGSTKDVTDTNTSSTRRAKDARKCKSKKTKGADRCRGRKSKGGRKCRSKKAKDADRCGGKKSKGDRKCRSKKAKGTDGCRTCKVKRADEASVGMVEGIKPFIELRSKYILENFRKYESAV